MSIAENNLIQVVEFFKSFGGMNTTDLLYKIEQYEDYRLGLLARSPFQIGDTVELAKDPGINEKDTPGWMHCKHFLIKGARAEVRSMDFYKKSFSYGLWFEKDSWAQESEYCETRKKIVRFDPPLLVPTKDKGEFWFNEGYLKLVSKSKIIEPVATPELDKNGDSFSVVKARTDLFLKELSDLWPK